MRKLLPALMTLALCLFSSVARAELSVTELSSGAEPEHLVSYQISSDLIQSQPASDGYLLLVEAYPATGLIGAEFVPFAALNGVDCDNGGGCLTLGSVITDPLGSLAYYAAAFVPGQAINVSLRTDELCWSSATQIPDGIAYSPVVAAGCGTQVPGSQMQGYAQTGPIQLEFQVYAVPADGLTATLMGSTPIDESDTITLAP